MSAATSMLAVRVHHYGGPDALTLEEVPIPEPSPNGLRHCGDRGKNR